MEVCKIKSEGVMFTFHVRKDTTEPCSVCGVPACTGEDFLWYEDDDKKNHPYL